MSIQETTPPVPKPTSPENPDGFGSTGTSDDDALFH